MTVTAVEEYKKNKYRIYLNDAFAFVLYKGDLRHFDITEGRELDDADLAQIRAEIVKRAKLRTMHLLQSRDYTESAMRRKLKENLYPEDVIEEALAYVKGYHYIDDRRYAMSFITSHAASLTNRQISEKLRMKGIAAELITECLSDYEAEHEMSDHGFDADDGTSGNRSREEQLLYKKMGDKLKRIPEDAPMDHAAKQKLFASFYRKGFSLSLIERVYEELTRDSGNVT
ncbi:MAG: RecX family transcriptional regulator [Lachnospiraceae bacterium]|nr:RecX family transcriptional regulator [Lachnospiraceae bacterium]